MRYGIIISFLICCYSTNLLALNIVASIKEKAGEVSIFREKRVLAARAGLVLKDQDSVVTSRNGKVTIIFRDGSEIRLFQNTNFKIEKTREAGSGKRGFLNRFKLKLGSFWGKFTRSKHRTTIQTPTATCGIKGTNVSFSEGAEGLDVSLSNGLVEIRNETERLMLTPGKMVEGVKRQGEMKNKVKDIPYRLWLKAETALKVPENGTRKLTLSVQLMNVKTESNAYKSGTVYFSSNIDQVDFPPVHLNSRGFANFHATVKPFKKADYDKGKLDVFAIMDGTEIMNVGSGFMTLPIKTSRKRTKTFHIDASAGAIQ